MTVTYDQIAKRAYEIWEEEGRPEGREQDHWYRAEMALRQEQALTSESNCLKTDDPSLLRPETLTSATPVAPAPASLASRSRTNGRPNRGKIKAAA